MKTAIFLIFAVIALGIGMQMLKRMAAGKEKSKGAFEPKQIATINEQGMFWRLVSAFPANEYIVLTQVSFGALLTAKGGASRYSFSQKIADFVLINKGFKVLAIIELDDSSHKGREAKDESRDAMLIEAGYKVLRYTRAPEIEQLRQDITIQPSQLNQ